MYITLTNQGNFTRELILMSFIKLEITKVLSQRMFFFQYLVHSFIEISNIIQKLKRTDHQFILIRIP